MTKGASILPEPQRRALRRACRLQLVWLAVLASIVTAIYFSLGNSQAMKTAWVEDLLSFVPPLAFLVSVWFEARAPSDRFPFGFIRGLSIGYLVSAVALAAVGGFLIVDSAMALIKTEHPTIGTVRIFGVTIWFGWLMIAALIYSVILPVIFGRMKLKLAHSLHDKILLSDALMNKADWMTGLAAALGVVGIGMGWWWADAVAALIIAVDVLHDGVKHTGAAIRDLVDEMPRTLDDSAFEPLIREVRDHVDGLDWVASSRLRLRQEGRFLTGTVFVVPRQEEGLTARIEAEERALLGLSWRIHDVSIMPRQELRMPSTAPAAGDMPAPIRPGAIRLTGRG
ncbi:MAG TPA: cation transporter [Citreicella sp.]|jgi:cation diffusion facilitator family transporter|uniref:Cation diffusion facilitator family transporter n=1 Tax=Salipiger marinus TaxID=555512 RepID=A0A1G8M0B1_9RHOB|nr:cation transporter [Salipiger marinus]SDI61366.1 cation diffusion facilitator family transporter [Salipiger marinus]HBM62017.1 cation transporter [Citreicella sp.]